ncbi:MAG: alcohol dehydrogenase catalytic domain-containing protein [Dehalococcoidia bacterium]
MKAIVKTRKEPGIEVLDVESPEIGDTDILVKVAAGSLCGSDVHIYEWTPGYEWLPLPVTLGHEFAGQVVEVGSKVQNVAVGDRITALPLMSCSRCAMCQVGKGDSCTSKKALGLTTNGAFAEYVRLTAAANIFKLPQNVSYEAASMCEPLSVALNAVELSGIKPGHTAAVLGPGPIGLLTLQVLRIAGASLVMVAGTSADKKRLDVAERLGADIVVDVDKEDTVSRAMESSGRFDFVFEATGNPKSVPQALSMVRSGGKVILIGVHPGPAEFDPTELVRGRKSLIGAYAYGPETWERTLALLASGRVTVEPMITHRIPLSEAREGFELALRREAAKVLFIP